MDGERIFLGERLKGGVPRRKRSQVGALNGGPNGQSLYGTHAEPGEAEMEPHAELGEDEMEPHAEPGLG